MYGSSQQQTPERGYHGQGGKEYELEANPGGTGRSGSRRSSAGLTDQQMLERSEWSDSEYSVRSDQSWSQRKTSFPKDQAQPLPQARSAKAERLARRVGQNQAAAAHHRRSTGHEGQGAGYGQQSAGMGASPQGMYGQDPGEDPGQDHRGGDRYDGSRSPLFEPHLGDYYDTERPGAMHALQPLHGHYDDEGDDFDDTASTISTMSTMSHMTVDHHRSGPRGDVPPPGSQGSQGGGSRRSRRSGNSRSSRSSRGSSSRSSTPPYSQEKDKVRSYNAMDSLEAGGGGSGHRSGARGGRSRGYDDDDADELDLGANSYYQTSKDRELEREGERDSLLTSQVVLGGTIGMGQGRPVVLLLVAIVLAIVGLAGGDHFMSSDVVRLPTEPKLWDSVSGFTVSQFIGLLLQTFLLPLSGEFLVLFAIQSCKHEGWSPRRRVGTYGALIVMLISGAVYSGTVYADYILSCGVLCINNSVRTYESGFVVAVGLIYVLVAAALALLFTVLFLHSSREALARMRGDFNDRSNHGPSMARALVRQRDGRLAVAMPRRTRAATLQRVLGAIAVLLVLQPACIFLALALPSTFSEFNHWDIEKYEKEDLDRSDELDWVWEIPVSAGLVLKLYPDLALYYGFIYLVALGAVLSRLIPPTRRQLRVQVRGCYGLSLGELLLLLALILLLALEFTYWFFVHGWDCKTGDDTDANCDKSGSLEWKEKLARSLGRLANVVLGLVVLPLSRHSVLTGLLGISWDKTTRVYFFLCYTLLLVYLGQQGVWWMVFKDHGVFPTDVLPLPYSTLDPSNWTIPLQVICSWVAFLVLGVLGHRWVRRWCWELFHYSHHLFLATFFAVLWQDGAWQYVLSGLGLWFLDRFLRLGKSLNDVRLQSLEGDNDTNVVTLSYLMDTVDACCRCAEGCQCSHCSLCGICPHSKEYTPLRHEMGQFVLLNIPALSTLEWHPFSISSSPGDDVTTHHIKAQGHYSWTGRLLALAKQVEVLGSFNPGELVVNVEGPYGVPVTHTDFDALFLVAGGMGITPLHSTFRALYRLASHTAPRYSSVAFNFPERIHLIWTAPHQTLFDIFLPTLLEVLEDDLDGRFSFKLYVTQGFTRGTGREGSKGGKAGKGRKDGASQGLVYESGRPNLSSELRRVSHHGNRALLYVCGPEGLVQDCRTLARETGVAFRADSFQL